MEEEELERTEKGIFDYYKIEKVFCQRRYLYQRIIELKEKENNKKPFLEEIELPLGGVGSGNGRLWIPYVGNLHGCIGIPCSMFKNSLEQELFPLFTTVGIRDMMNKYAPGQYCIKFPNDIICKSHSRKSAGILVRKEKGWALCIFCVNFIKAPSDENLRIDGFKACCMKNHTSNLPSIQDFLQECGMYFFELMKKYDTVEKIVKMVNDALSENQTHIWKAIVNNPNADPVIDGALWTKACPKALTKGYLNGQEYETKSTYYDINYFTPYRNNDIKEINYLTSDNS